jgi:hypothetical protein
MPPAYDQTNTVEKELRVVVDAQIVLAMFLARRDRPSATSPKRQLLKLLPTSTFRWLWTPDIINDYERGAAAIEADERIMLRAEFDRIGFQLFLAGVTALAASECLNHDDAERSPSYIAGSSRS